MVKSLQLSTDVQGNVVISGTFEGELSFDGECLRSGPEAAQFVAKFDASGKVLWSRVMSASGAEPSPCGVKLGLSPGDAPAGGDGAFTWLQSQAGAQVEPACAAPPTAPIPSWPGGALPIPLQRPVGGSYAQPATSGAVGDEELDRPSCEMLLDADRDSVEPVWLAGAVSQPPPSPQGPSWRGRMRHAAGYGAGLVGAALAAGVLTLSILHSPETLSAAGPTFEVERGSWTEGQASAELPPEAEVGPDGSLAAGPAEPLGLDQALDAAGALLARAPAAMAVASRGAAQAAAAAAASKPTVAPSAMAEAPAPRGTPAQLRERIVELLVAGQYEQALPWATTLVQADPHHALSYLCLGAVLLDLGRAGQAQQAFSECVRHATDGDASECAALGGRR